MYLGTRQLRSLLVRRLLALKHWRYSKGVSALPEILEPGSEVLVDSAVPLDFGVVRTTYSLQIQGLVHVGANTGQELSDYLEQSTGVVTLIEPLATQFHELTQLAKSMDSTRIRLLNVAIGTEPGKQPLYVANNEGQSSSLLRPKLHLHQAPHVVFDSLELVDVVRLDQIFSSQSIPNFLALDVQGFELQALQSAGTLLQKVDFVFTEINRAENYSGCTLIGDLDEYLSEFGLKRSLTRWQGTWGDAFYHRKTLVTKGDLRNDF